MEPTHRDIRAYLVEELKKDIVGPQKEDEELTEGPTSYYLSGILFPADTDINPEEDRDSGDAADEIDDEVDTGTLMATATNPSTIGLTFATDASEILTISLSVAVYLEDKQENKPSSWKRQSLDVKPIVLNVKRVRTKTITIVTGLKLFYRVRARGEQRIVTLSLMNTHRVARDTRPDQYCFFQPEIQVSSTTSGKPVFKPRHGREGGYADPDRTLSELLYQHAPEYAVGHGCGVEWDALEGEPATQLRTSMIPSYELLQLTPKAREHFTALEMSFLSDSKKDDLIQGLRVLPARYREWLGGLKPEDRPADLQEMARQNIRECEIVAARIEQGIRLIDEDEQVREAFQLANRAMLKSACKGSMVEKVS